MYLARCTCQRGGPIRACPDPGSEMGSSSLAVRLAAAARGLPLRLAVGPGGAFNFKLNARHGDGDDSDSQSDDARASEPRLSMTPARGAGSVRAATSSDGRPERRPVRQGGGCRQPHPGRRSGALLVASEWGHTGRQMRHGRWAPARGKPGHWLRPTPSAGCSGSKLVAWLCRH